jgi:2,4-dienoyl-CoA reductase-like NADH-dependent reductase (Old Yellow Enzyme family)
LVSTQGGGRTRISGTLFFTGLTTQAKKVMHLLHSFLGLVFIYVGAVGLITSPKEANDILVEGKADVVSLAREFLRDPHFVMRAADELGVAVKPAVQYERAWQKVLTRF